MEITVPLNIPDPAKKTFHDWSAELIEENPDKNIAVTPPSASSWRGWGNELLIDELNYPGTGAYANWFFWATALREVET